MTNIRILLQRRKRKPYSFYNEKNNKIFKKMGAKPSSHKLDNLLLLGKGLNIIKKYARDIKINGMFITGKIGKVDAWSYVLTDDPVETQAKSWKYLVSMLKGEKIAALCFDQTEDLLSNEMKLYITEMYNLTSFKDLVVVSLDKLAVDKTIANLNYVIYLWYPNKNFKVWNINFLRKNEFIKYIKSL